MQKRVSAFTLVELMIVVAIVSILLAVAIPNFLQFQIKYELREESERLKAVMEQYENGEYWPCSGEWKNVKGNFFTCDVVTISKGVHDLTIHYRNKDEDRPSWELMERIAGPDSYMKFTYLLGFQSSPPKP